MIVWSDDGPLFNVLNSQILAIRRLNGNGQRPRKTRDTTGFKIHDVTSSIAHDTVWRALQM
jgi:hypothetical protein